MSQPIIRGVHAVGSVKVVYKYNGNNGKLMRPTNWGPEDAALESIDTGAAGVEVAGFRLDGEFIRAAQQIASSVTVPILGGGGVSLTNNNRTGTLTINSTRVSSPDVGQSAWHMSADNITTPDKAAQLYDLVLLAQWQQATDGGDSAGADIEISFDFMKKGTKILFQSCTVANVAPMVLSGNDVPNYNVEFNYLSWYATFLSSTAT